MKLNLNRFAGKCVAACATPLFLGMIKQERRESSRNQVSEKKSVEKIAKALADTHRLDILQMLVENSELCCSEVVALSSLSQPTVSHHIKILVESGLLSSQKSGRQLKLSLNRSCFDHFQSNLERFIREGQ